MSVSKALNNSQILRAALVVLSGFVASGLLGFVRTGVFSAIFGASAELDAFYAAQRIPELLFTLVAGGALGSSFIPVFARYLNDKDMDHAWKLASAVMTLSAGVALILALLVMAFAPVIVPTILVPGASSEQASLTILLTQIMLLTTVIFAVSGLVMGILNAHQTFLYPALAASMYNIGMIIGAVIISPALPAYSVDHALSLGLVDTLPAYATTNPDGNVFGLALGAILGASLHLLVQVPGLFQVKARLRVLFDWRLEGVREVLILMGPRVLGLAVVQINFVVNVAFASMMIPGSQTALTTAWFLTFFTLGVIAQSMGTAVFPSLSALAATGDMDGYKGRLEAAMRSVLFLAFPAMAGLIVLGEPVVSIFERGEWTSEHTQATAWALAFFAMGMAGHSLLEVLSRAFYALADTWTPVRVGIAAMVANIILSVLFIQIIGDPESLVRGPFAGLALANSLTTLLEAAYLWWLLNRRLSGIHDRQIIKSGSRAFVASLVMGAVVWGAMLLLSGQANMLRLIIGVGAGVSTYFLLALLLRMDEVSSIMRRVPVARRLWSA